MGLDVDLWLYEGLDPDRVVTFLRLQEQIYLADWDRPERAQPFQATDAMDRWGAQRMKEITDMLDLPDADEINRRGVRVGFHPGTAALYPILIRSEYDVGFGSISRSVNSDIDTVFGWNLADVFGGGPSSGAWWHRPNWDNVHLVLNRMLTHLEAQKADYLFCTHKAYYSEALSRFHAPLEEEHEVYLTELADEAVTNVAETLSKVLASVGYLLAHPVGNQIILRWG